MSMPGSLRMWVVTVVPAILIMIAPIPLSAQGAGNTGTDVKLHKFVPVVPPENSAFAATTGQQTVPGQIAPVTSQQVQLLLQEKASRTPVQKKIDSNILYTIRMMQGLEAAPGVTSLYTGVDLDQDNRIVVDITADVSDQLLQLLQTAGALVLDSHPEYRSIRAIIPAAQIEIIAALPDVSFVGRKAEFVTSRRRSAPTGRAPAQKKFYPGFEDRAARVRKQLAEYLQKQNGGLGLSGTTGVVNTGQGSVTTEGDATHLSARARGVFGVNGSGLKIGVLSDSANSQNSVTNAQATGDMPPTCPGPGGPCLTIVQENPSGGADEGTAIMEIIYDMAPGANLYFATAGISEANFASNIQALRAAGCNIIVDDSVYFDEPVFQDGIVAQAVNSVTASGALYFSSAGNYGNVDAGTAGYFEGDFNSAGSPAFPNGTKPGTVHNFGNGLLGNTITEQGDAYTLEWADPYGASSNDYDLFLVNSSGLVKASSTNIQNGNQNPVEIISPPALAAGDMLVVFKANSASPRLFALKTVGGTLSVVTPGEIWGHSAAVDAYSIAATPAAAAFGTGYPTGPFPNPFTTANQAEPFNSDGPRRIIFNSDGTPITPGNFSSTGGVVRNKPDFTAADGVSTTVTTGSLSPFYGTSAAAPHAASIAALIESANPSLTPAQIRTTLTGTALDIAATGFDRDTGNGIVMAYAALSSLGLKSFANPEIAAVTASENPGNGDGVIEPGEGALLVIQLKNQYGVADATGITGVLTTITPGVTITQPAVSSFPDLQAGFGIGSNLTPFMFTVTNSAACALNIEFTLTLTYAGGPAATKALNFSVQTGFFTISNNLGGTDQPEFLYHGE